MFVKGKFYEADSGKADGDTSTGEGELPGIPEAPVEETKPAASEIKLTSAQLADRLERAKNTERDKLLKELGYDSPDALKQFIEAGRKALDAQKSDEERQAEALRQLQEQNAAFEAKARAAEDKANLALMQAEALSLMAGRFANPKAAFRLLDMTNVKIEDGNIIGMEAAVEALAEAEPWVLLTQRKAPQNLTTNPKTESEVVKEAEDEKRKRYFGSTGSSDFFKPSVGSRIKTS